MSVTVISSPSSYTPACNPQWFKCSSTETAQANFRYRIVFTDLISSATITKDQDKDASGYLDLDASAFAKQYITQALPYGNYGFNVNTGAVRKIRVNVGEVYGSTPTYYAGANTDYIVWNGAIDFLDMQSYASSSYLYNRATSNIKYISNGGLSTFTYGSLTSNYFPNDKTCSSFSNYIYALCAIPGTYNNFEQIEIRGYNSAGTLLATTVVANPNASSTNYINNYSYIDVGYKGLLNMPVGQIASGTYPIPVSTYDYWDVYDTNTGVGAGNQTVLIKRIYKECEPRFDVSTIHYLSPEGSYETALCKKLSIRRTQDNKSYYSKLPYTYGAYTYASAIERPLFSNERRQITVNTDWLEESEARQYRDIFSSTSVYLDQGDTGGWISVKVLNNSYEEKKKYNSSLISISVDLEYSHINPRQPG